MKTQPKKLILALALLALLTLNSQLTTAFAQGTAFTYQGRMTDNGTNFNGMGQFAFALVTSTNANHTATATANAPSGGFITGYTLTGGGTGYTVAPIVTISGGGGSGATATATISGGAVTGLTVSNPGNGGYTSAPMVTIAPPPTNISYTTYWSNDGTSVNGSEPSVAVNVAVANGLFTVVFGDTTVPGMAVIPTTLFLQPNLQLRIWFNDGTHGFAVLDPAQTLTPAPYASFANTASNLVGGLSIQQNSSGAPNVIGGASVNTVASGVVGATIGGGGAVDQNGHSYTNSVTAVFGTVSGGAQNIASGEFATVSGGVNNTASDDFATVGGGDGNTASGYQATVSGGAGNTASGQNATVGGGGGNTASGQSSFAAGFDAQALHDGSFVWADLQSGVYSSDRANQFKIRAGGGVQMDVSGSSGLNPAAVTVNSTSANGVGLVVNESSSDTAALFANNGAGDLVKGFSGGGNTVFEVLNDGTVKSKGMMLTSDRNAKENFKPLDAQTVLAKIAAMPVSEWNYKDDPASQKHIGPMAQDFHAAFGLNGVDDKHISVVDEGGVALAAIQGLNQKLEEELNRQNTENVKLKQQNDLLAEQLNKLEVTVKSLVNNK